MKNPKEGQLEMPRQEVVKTPEEKIESAKLAIETDIRLLEREIETEQRFIDKAEKEKGTEFVVSHNMPVLIKKQTVERLREILKYLT